MIPPVPPVPSVPEYTYASSSPVTLGSVTGTLYTSIQYNGTDCVLIGEAESGVQHRYTGLILYEVDGVDYCYYVTSSSLMRGILANNSAMNTTCTTYLIQNGNVTQSDPDYLQSSSPSDYYENIKSGNFTLVQRS